MFSWEWKSGGIEKVNLYKFTHIPLLKKDTQLKPKKVTNNQKKKKSKHQNLFKKSCSKKKIHISIKKKKQYEHVHWLPTQ